MRHIGNKGLRFMTAKVFALATPQVSQLDGLWHLDDLKGLFNLNDSTVLSPMKNMSSLHACSLSTMKKSNELLKVRSDYLFSHLTVITQMSQQQVQNKYLGNGNHLLCP